MFDCVVLLLLLVSSYSFDIMSDGNDADHGGHPPVLNNNQFGAPRHPVLLDSDNVPIRGGRPGRGADVHITWPTEEDIESTARRHDQNYPPDLYDLERAGVRLGTMLASPTALAFFRESLVFDVLVVDRVTELLEVVANLRLVGFRITINIVDGRWIFGLEYPERSDVWPIPFDRYERAAAERVRVADGGRHRPYDDAVAATPNGDLVDRTDYPSLSFIVEPVVDRRTLAGMSSQVFRDNFSGEDPRYMNCTIQNAFFAYPDQFVVVDLPAGVPAGVADSGNSSSSLGLDDSVIAPDLAAAATSAAVVGSGVDDAMMDVGIAEVDKVIEDDRKPAAVPGVADGDTLPPITAPIRDATYTGPPRNVSMPVRLSSLHRGTMNVAFDHPRGGSLDIDDLTISFNSAYTSSFDHSGYMQWGISITPKSADCPYGHSFFTIADLLAQFGEVRGCQRGRGGPYRG